MRADLFCRVVDNYGDIGVCWRLARRLANGLGWQVRLWADDLCAFARIQPGLDTAAARQWHTGVQIIHWRATPPSPLPAPGDVVIEAFACDPPAEFVDAVRVLAAGPSGQGPAAHGRGAGPVWINLEYLSAEDWVEGCHGIASRRADGLVKYFFFPGFTPATGGLLREPGLTAERDALQASRETQNDFLRRLGLDDAALAAHRLGARVLSLFCYPRASADLLAKALGGRSDWTLMLVPEGVAPGLDAHAGGALRIARVPFVAQPDFDRLLWCADVNFVRGEDSFVRAAWAARPLVWHIYPQDGNTHLEKLEAWLARYPAPEAARHLARAWNGGTQAQGAAAPGLADALQAALSEPTWSAWQAAARAWAAEQAAGPDLADKLAIFCAEKLKTR
ncbi:elongation factor P maturation arginine rhamnosyltransferase EarP [Bordetella sp. FB-8]|uniref:elongation factor P maturation arginine rhamnosyltransferase EarP n=1 Tax=Bordetella sp. FB-8 TaxID=1159870 RepID=UPI000476E967|nr:elongation factor P maturation arginine rhamnosyltransferase EarP [Bordetella sp. FB-8]